MHKPYVVDMDDIRHEDKKMLCIKELIQLMAYIFNECYIFSTERHNLNIINKTLVKEYSRQLGRTDRFLTNN